MTAERDSRPKPQYGEYADPISEAQAEASVTQGATDQSAVAPTVAQAPSHAPAPMQPVASQPARNSVPIPGVPHNLGARGSSGQTVQPAPQQAANTASGDPANHAAAGAPHGPTPAPSNTAAAAGPGTAPARPRSVDRIVTIFLLAVGSYFALSMALTLSQFALEFSKIADELGVKDFVAPSSLKTLGTIGAILVLAIYALVLIFSIRRLRARKMTFWAPIVAGVLAWVVFFILFFIGLNQSAELWQALVSIASDPAAAQQMLERLNSNG